MVLPQTQSTPRKETSPYGKIISGELPEMQQQNGFLSLRKRFTWTSKVSVQEVSALVALENLSRHRKTVYPSCPVCGWATYLHHNRAHYSHFSCRRCGHSLSYQSLPPFQIPSMSKLFGKTDFK